MARRLRIYTANDLLHVTEAKADDETWWCVAAASEVGDIGLLYQVGTGIQFAFRVQKLIEYKAICRRFNMATAAVKIVKRFKPPVSAAMLKSHRRLKTLKAVRRSFQGSWFDVESGLHDDLVAMLKISVE